MTEIVQSLRFLELLSKYVHLDSVRTSGGKGEDMMELAASA